MDYGGWEKGKNEEAGRSNEFYHVFKKFHHLRTIEKGQLTNNKKERKTNFSKGCEKRHEDINQSVYEEVCKKS